jgi:hypothetical protein
MGPLVMTGHATAAEIEAAHRDAQSRLRERRVLSRLSRVDYEKQRQALDYARRCALEALNRRCPAT